LLVSDISFLPLLASFYCSIEMLFK